MVRTRLLAPVLALILAAPAAAAVTWPAGMIVQVGPNGSLGTSKLTFLQEGDTLFPMARSSNSGDYWEVRPAGYSGAAGGSYWVQYAGFAPGGSGNLLHLRFVSGAQLELGGHTWSGAVLPPTLLTGPANAFSQQNAFSACAADGGGGWFQFNFWKPPAGVRLLRATSTGTVAPGWPALGWRVATAGVNSYYPTGIAADGAGGVLLMLGTNLMRVVRVTGDTTFTPGWPAGGLALEQTVTDYSLVFHAKLLRSDATHFLAIWAAYLPLLGPVLKCQRFSLDGTLDPAWPADGVVIRDPVLSGYDWDSQYEFQAVPDGAGGVTVAWDDSSRVWVRHVLANGAFPPAYTARELALVDLTGTSANHQRFGLARGLGDGVAIVFSSNDWALRGRWFDGDGAPDPSPSLHDRVFFTGAQLDSLDALYYFRGCSVGATGDGEGGVFFSWNAEPLFIYNNVVMLSHDPGPGSVLSVPPAAPATIALAAGPNPARGELTARFVLPDARPARLELLDLGGRRVRALEVRGEGPHAERLAGLGGLAPGVYVLRIAHGGTVRAMRVAVIR